MTKEFVDKDLKKEDLDEFNNQCEECKSFWCDPWFDDNSAAQIFTQGSPDHPASWSSFEQWLCKPEHKATLANERLYLALENRKYL